MSGRQRLGLLAVAAVIAVAAVLLLRSDEEDESPASPTDTAPAGKTTKAKPPLLQAGKERTLEFKKGDTVVFRVRSAKAEEVHVHGYDIKRDIAAGSTVTLRFPAKLEGVFEVELEHSKASLGELEVSP